MNKIFIKFCVNQLIVDGQYSKISNFDLILDDDFQTHTITDGAGKIEILSIKKIKKEIREDRFVFIYLEEGDRFPYADKVIDSNLKEVDNPRSVDKIELTDQFFALIDIKNSRIFLSDQRKKKVFISWLEKKTSKTFVIKPLIPENEFMDNIKSISEISLTIEPTLFSSISSNILSKELVNDIYGFGAKEATIKLVYNKDRSIKEEINEKIKKLLKKKSEFKNVTVIGRTSNNLESILNLEEVISKIDISVIVSENTKKINQDEVLAELILKIKTDENK